MVTHIGHLRSTYAMTTNPRTQRTEPHQAR
jgi:hypothetical protein